MIKLFDYIVKRLEEYGIRHVFMISGGGATHLDDSIGKSSKITYICNHHEQACAMAAEGYARTSGRLSVAVVTSGPGSTNTLTGLIGQWLDSVPVLYISGQIKFETTIASCPEVGLRQLGDQEINIVDIVRPVTKFATMLTNPLDVKKVLDKGLNHEYTADSSRLKAELGGYVFVSYEDAIKDLFNYYSKNLDKIDKNLVVQDPYLARCKTKESLS